MLKVLCTHWQPFSSFISLHSACGLRTCLFKSCSEDRRFNYPMGFPTSSKCKSSVWVLQCHCEGRGRQAWLSCSFCLLTALPLKASATGTMLSLKTSFTDGKKNQRDVNIRSVTHVTAQFESPNYSEFLVKLACSVSNTQFLRLQLQPWWLRAPANPKPGCKAIHCSSQCWAQFKAVPRKMVLL